MEKDILISFIVGILLSIVVIGGIATTKIRLLETELLIAQTQLSIQTELARKQSEVLIELNNKILKR